MLNLFFGTKLVKRRRYLSGWLTYESFRLKRIFLIFIRFRYQRFARYERETRQIIEFKFAVVYEIILLNSKRMVSFFTQCGIADI